MSVLPVLVLLCVMTDLSLAQTGDVVQTTTEANKIPKNIAAPDWFTEFMNQQRDDWFTEFMNQQRDAVTSEWHTLDQLMKTKLRVYNRELRPVLNQSQAVNVGFQMYITHLEEVNERQQTITLNGWFHLSWVDEKIAWEKDMEYGDRFKDIDRVHWPQLHLWTPDLTLYNSVTVKDMLFSWHHQANVYSNGTVSFDPTTQFTAYCSFNFESWPWDSQECTLMFGSWTYDSSKIRFFEIPYEEHGSVIFWTAYRKHGYNWHITRVKVEVTNGGDLASEAEYLNWSYIQVKLSLKRHAQHTASFIVLPLIVTSFLTMLSFCVYSALIRMGILIGNLLLQFVYIAMLSQLVPPTNTKEPFIVSFTEFNMFLTLTACIFAVVVNRISQRPSSKPPHSLLQRILDHAFCRRLAGRSGGGDNYEVQLVDQLDIDAGGDHHQNERVIERSSRWVQLASLIDMLSFLAFGSAYAIGFANLASLTQ